MLRLLSFNGLLIVDGEQDRSGRGGIQTESLRNWKNGRSRELGGPSWRFSPSLSRHFHPWKYLARHSLTAIIERDAVAQLHRFQSRGKGVLFLVKLVCQSESRRENGGDGTGAAGGRAGKVVDCLFAARWNCDQDWLGMIIWRTRVSTLPDANDDVQVAGLSLSSSLDTREPHPRHFPREYPFSYPSNSLATRMRRNYQCHWVNTKKALLDSSGLMSIYYLL